MGNPNQHPATFSLLLVSYSLLPIPYSLKPPRGPLDLSCQLFNLVRLLDNIQ
jgi:hypothetical protein